MADVVGEGSPPNRRWATLLGVIVALALVITSCSFDDGDDDETTEAAAGPSEEEATGVPLDKKMSDNGYGDVTLGRTLAELEDQYGDRAFTEVETEADGVVSYAITDIAPLQLIFANGVLSRVNVTTGGLESIKGNHEVGDPIDDVLNRYRQRIDNGESISITCSTNAVIARARQAYRLVFYFDSDDRVSEISALDRGRIEPGEPCTKIDAPIVDKLVEPEIEPEPVTLDDFVPDRLGDNDILLRNPSTDQISGRYGLMWSLATDYYKTLNVIDIVSTFASCLYEGDPPALRVAVYKPGRLVVAVAVQHIASVQNAACVLLDVLIPSFLCQNCAVIGPAVDGYLAEIDGVTYAVAYGTISGGSTALEEMCDALPHCSDTTFTTIPDAMVDTDGA